MPWHRSLLSLLCALPLTAHAGEPLSLEEAVGRALQSAPQVSARTANLEAVQSLATSAGRLPDPELVVGVDNLPVTGPDAYSTTSDFMTMRKVGVMQAFPAATKRKLQGERAAAAADVAQAELVESRLAVAREVAQAWIRRATAEASLNELGVLESDLELQASAARAALAAGRSSTAEALAAQTAAAQFHARLLRVKSEVRQATFELARWLDADADRPLAAMPSLDELPAPPAALLASVHEHGSLLTFESQIAAARLDVDLAKAERRPDWSAELAFAKRGPEFSDMVSLEFRVGLPLFTKYRQNPQISARHAELRQLEAEREAELRMHTAEIHQVLTQWEELGERARQYEQELLPLAHERSRAALASFRTGRGELRLALEAYEQESEFIIEHAELLNERGLAWAFLRYLDREHLHEQK
ncbi:MAG TPA: TolC family protein [Steroidobacteraceae bacterium]|jgi:outer membrane protein TolC|nr:TolC family protein [Steroidobacteraceae bacterium]